MSSIVSQPPLRKSVLLPAMLRQGEIWLAAAAVLALALLTRHLVVANTDVSWGFTLAEKLLAGERPYVDFVEANPPVPIYLYLPAVVIARYIGLTPELVMDGLIFTAIAGSLWVAAGVLRRAGLLARHNGAALLGMVMTIVAILPAQIFGEREHIALVLFLPMLCVMLARAHGAAPGRSDIVVAGLGAGAMMVLKPHLAIGVAATIATAAWSARSWPVLVAAENWIAGAVVAAYGAVIAIVYPEFLRETVPLLGAVYLPIRRSWWDLLVGLPAVSIWIAAVVGLVLLRRSERWDRLYGMLLAASIGFSASFFFQGKGWPYHSYPMLALVLIALACALAERRTQAPGVLVRAGWAVAAGCLAAVTFTWMNLATSLASLEAPIRAIKAHPTMLAISHDIAVGHPLVRAVGGTWVAPVASLWITRGAVWRREHGPLTHEENAELDRYVALDRAMLIDALRNRRPDVIVVQKEPVDFAAWARADAEIDALLKPYREAASTPEILVLRRDGS
ncbi:MAG TPA: hypothetical protein VMQ73_05355 [Methylomirabilota bacterium]|nr:hypothetical protein [Methylomirabilota bacterium]